MFNEPSCLPLGEGAERSEAEGGCATQLNIVPVSSNFPMPIGHNANFAWNQDEVSQNSRYAERFFYSSLLSAQSGSCQTNQLRSSSLLLGTLSHGAHEPISIVLRTCFLDAPACGSGHLFAVIFIPCMTLYSSVFTLYFKLNF